MMKRKLSVRIEKEEGWRMDQLCSYLGCTVSEIVREAVEGKVKEYEGDLESVLVSREKAQLLLFGGTETKN